MRLTFLFFIFGFSVSVFAQHNISFLGQKTYSEDLSDVWGYAKNGKEYALVGVRSGISIVDVTVPANPTQLFLVTTATSDWHDIAIWKGYAYVTNETGGGLRIINLNYLPDSVHSYSWTGGTLNFSKGHTVFMDENGIAYIAGANANAGNGVLMIDVDSNAINPPLVGRYNLHYVHEVYARGDTMWVSEINNGFFSVVDVSDKSNPIVLTTNATPSNATHNVWLSGDGKTLLTTDEIPNSYAASYDVSDLSDIKLLDLFQSNPGSGSIVHNIHYLGNFAVASYYRDGVVILDASHPENLIEVGNYDTSPFSGTGYNGAWSVYPYLPSGNILVSDIEQGLFVLGPVYERACYLEGNVTDIANSSPLNNVDVTILPSTQTDVTNLSGDYKTGIADSGTYSVQFSKTGYNTHVENNVVMKNGLVTTLNVQLIPAIPVLLTGSVVNISNGQKIPNSNVLFQNSINTYQTIADSNGDFSISNFETGIYDAFAGKWGFLTKQQSVNVFSATSVVLGLQEGYYDDFLFDFNWTTASTATTGVWERGEPVGTIYDTDVSNPDLDVPDDFGDACFVTGNGGGQAGDDDVDDGTVTLTTPLFDLSDFHDPYINYSRWFYNGGGTQQGPDPDDTLFVSLSNGVTANVIDTVTAATGNNGWNAREVRVKDILTPTANMTLSFITSDIAATGHIVEAGVDLFFVFDSNSVEPPAIDFVSDKTEGCPDDAFTMTDLTTNQPQTWFWEFPGGNPPSSTDENPTVVYPNPGNYDITLSSTNAGGSSSTTKASLVVVHELPSIQSTVTDASSPINTDGSITISVNTSVPPSEIAWSTGSTSSTIDNLSPGDYEVTVTDSLGCQKMDTITVGVNTSIKSTKDFTLNLFPNPFNQNIQIASSENLTLTFYNSVGVKLDRIELQSGKNITWGKNDKPGIYFVVISKNNSQREVIKLIKIQQ